MKNGQQTQTFYELNGFILDPVLNYLSATVHVAEENYKGIMGLSDIVSPDLFLKDGVYSLWNRGVPDPKADGKAPGKNMYGSNPFYMARANNSNWFGVFHNLAAAQDHWVQNDAANGKVYIRTFATSGVGSIYFFTGIGPE